MAANMSQLLTSRKLNRKIGRYLLDMVKGWNIIVGRGDWPLIFWTFKASKDRGITNGCCTKTTNLADAPGEAADAR